MSQGRHVLYIYPVAYSWTALASDGGAGASVGPPHPRKNKSSCPASEEEEEKIVSWDNLGEGLRDLRELIYAFQEYFWGRRGLVDASAFEVETVDQLVGWMSYVEQYLFTKSAVST